MPPEIVIVSIFAMAAGVTALITVTKIIVNFLERRHGSSSGPSLTQTELRTLIASAVAEATAPIEDELVKLQRQLGAGRDPNLLGEHGDTEKAS